MAERGPSGDRPLRWSGHLQSAGGRCPKPTIRRAPPPADAKADVPGFVVSAPTDLSADDDKDPAKVKAYNDAKKASDDYTAQAKPSRWR